MKTIEVSESALESLKAMAQKLQEERDALYQAIYKISTEDDAFLQRRAMDDAILLVLSMDSAACQESTKVMES